MAETLADGARYRLVPSYTVHEGNSPLLGRVEQVVPPDADYVVLDLDRTVHLGVTIGEQLGWEIMADPRQRSTGAEDLPPFFTARRPLRSLEVLTRATRYWGLPGLLYASTVRLGNRWHSWHRFLMLTYGHSYVDRVQSLLRTILMTSAADYTPEELDVFAERAWRRWQHRLVVDQEVVAAIRRHCRRLKAVLLSSASTLPTVDHAARVLGVDGFVASAVDVYPDGDRQVYSAPVGTRLVLGKPRPRFFSRPGAVIHNAATNKVSFLRVHFPEVFAASAVSVAVTDNNYGEDRTWPDHFNHVVALNSRHPFSPFVAADSPCMSLQVVDALPIGAEQVAESKKLAWHGTLRAVAYDAGALSGRFPREEIGRVETLTDRLREARERAAGAVDASYRHTMASIGMAISDAVERYNRASAKQKAAIARELARTARTAGRARSRLTKLGRECEQILYELECAHDRAARALVAREP